MFKYFLFVFAALKCDWFVSGAYEWTQQQKLVANDGAAGDRFGSSVVLDGDTLVIVAYWDDTSKTYTVERGDLADGKIPVWPQDKLEKTVEEIITEAVETTGNFITSIDDPRVVSFRTGVTG